MVAVPRVSGKARRQANPRRAWPASATQPEALAAPALSQAILSELLGRRPGRNGLSAASEAQGQGLWTLALCSSLQTGHFASAIWKFLSAFALFPKMAVCPRESRTSRFGFPLGRLALLRRTASSRIPQTVEKLYKTDRRKIQQNFFLFRQILLPVTDRRYSMHLFRFVVSCSHCCKA